MSKLVSLEDLYKAKAEYYEEKYNESESYIRHLDSILEAMKNCNNCKYDCDDTERCISGGYKEWKIDGKLINKVE